MWQDWPEDYRLTLPADGVFGSLTAGAVRTYQEDAGILIDGVVGAGTRSSMAADLGLSGLVSCTD